MSNNVSNLNQDHFHEDKPQVFAVARSSGGDWTFNRRDFVKAAGTAAGAAAAVNMLGAQPRTAHAHPLLQEEMEGAKAHAGIVYSLAVSPDDSLLASGGGDNTVKLWAISSGALLQTLTDHTDAVRAVAFNPAQDLLALEGSESEQPANKLLASGSSDGTVKLWAAPGGELIQTLQGHSDTVLSVAFSPDGTLLASGSADGSVIVWSVSDGAPLHTLSGEYNAASRLAFSPDGALLAVGYPGDNDGIMCTLNSMVRLWSVSDGELAHELMGESCDINNVAFNQAGTSLTAVGGDNIRVWALPGGELVQEATIYGQNVTAAAFTSSQGLLVVGRIGGTVGLVSVPNGETVCTREGHKVNDYMRVFSAVVSADGTRAFTGCEYGVIRWWSLVNEQPVRMLGSHDDAVIAFAFSPDRSLLASCTNQGNLYLWALPDGELIRTLEDPEYSIASLAFSPDSSLLALGCVAWSDGIVRVQSTADDSVILEIANKPNADCLTFSPDGTLLAVGSDNMIKLWSVPDGSLIARMEGHTDPVAAITFSPDGTLLASIGYDDTTCLWAIPDGTRVNTIKSAMRCSVVFGSDGTWIAVGGFGEGVDLYSVPDGASIGTLKGDGELLAVSPDGTLLAGCSGSKGEIQLWSMPAGKPVTLLARHAFSLALAFNSDGSLLASGGRDQAIRLWPVPVPALVYDRTLADIAASLDTFSGAQYTVTGEDVITQSCGSQIPAGATCICNCVEGGICRCDGHTSGSGSGGHYWYPN
ncbi:MAG: WD40 repeat domain-containing protein [Anaerolineae bacterium]|nr:WD40 repeat domain-containing protein [Anaerolineae bacterium]